MTDPSNKAQQVRTMFARIARRYDLNNRLHSLWRDQAWRRAAAAMAAVKAGQDVLDVACGTGDLTAMLAAWGPRQIVGADFCPEMLALARKKFPHLRIEWLPADAMSLPFAPESFDVVTIAFGLRNLADPRARSGRSPGCCVRAGGWWCWSSRRTRRPAGRWPVGRSRGSRGT